MNWETIGLSLLGALLSIGAVATWMAKIMPNVTKWSILAKDAVETISDLSAALAKGPLTADEITKLQADAAQFKMDLAVALAK